MHTRAPCVLAACTPPHMCAPCVLAACAPHTHACAPCVLAACAPYTHACASHVLAACAPPICVPHDCWRPVLHTHTCMCPACAGCLSSTRTHTCPTGYTHAQSHLRRVLTRDSGDGERYAFPLGPPLHRVIGWASLIYSASKVIHTKSLEGLTPCPGTDLQLLASG